MPYLVSRLVGKQIAEARARVRNNARGEYPDHDDIVAKLMWGTWVKLIGRPITKEETALQQELWSSSVHNAFPNVDNSEEGRYRIARNLYFLRNVRNRAAHFDNLTQQALRIQSVVNASLFLLHSIDAAFTVGWVSPKDLRSMAKRGTALLISSYPCALARFGRRPAECLAKLVRR